MTLAEAKQTLRLSQSDTTHDADITDQIDASVELLEQDTDRVIIFQSFDHLTNGFPPGNRNFALSQKPIDSVESIGYLDTDGASQTVDANTYDLDQGRRHVYLKSGESWPQALDQQNSVTLSVIAGYGASESEVPRVIKRAILLMVGNWFYPQDGELFQKAYDRVVDRIVRTSYP